MTTNQSQTYSDAEVAAALAGLDRRSGRFGCAIGTGVFAACGVKTGEEGPAAKTHTEAVVLWHRQITSEE